MRSIDKLHKWTTNNLLPITSKQGYQLVFIKKTQILAAFSTPILEQHILDTNARNKLSQAATDV